MYKKRYPQHKGIFIQVEVLFFTFLCNLGFLVKPLALPLTLSLSHHSG